MILLFIFAFPAGLILLFTAFVRTAYHYGTSMSRLDRDVSRIRLRRHWRWTLLMFALAVYAGLSL